MEARQLINKWNLHQNGLTQSRIMDDLDLFAEEEIGQSHRNVIRHKVQREWDHLIEDLESNDFPDSGHIVKEKRCSSVSRLHAKVKS